jgi:hypothetical protein
MKELKELGQNSLVQFRKIMMEEFAPLPCGDNIQMFASSYQTEEKYHVTQLK